MYTTLISDFGCVLTYPQDDSWVERMLQELNLHVPPAVFKEHYRAYRNDYDAGLLDRIGYWQKVAGAFARVPSAAQIDRLVAYDIKSWFNINMEMIDFLKHIKPAFKRLVLLSNINDECARYLEKTCTWHELFDIRIYSCDEKVLKPHKTIYERTLARAGAAPEECIFIDDNPENIAGSRELGIEGIVFDHLAGLRARFRDLKLLD